MRGPMSDDFCFEIRKFPGWNMYCGRRKGQAQTYIIYCTVLNVRTSKCQMTTLVRRMGDLPTYDCLDFICCKAYQVPFQLQLL